MFDTFSGLPVHPLVVHLAVVALPVAALALLTVVLVPRWRAAYAPLAVIGLGVGVVAAFVAKESGEALAHRVGDPGDHAEYGDWLVPLAVLTFLASAAWWWLQRREGLVGRSRHLDGADPAGSHPVGRVSPLTRLLGLGAAALSLATIAMTVLVGHTGAKVVWAGSDATQSTPSASSTASAKTYTLAQVKKHATSTDCWAAIDGGVYNLTSWISKHPGGADRITAICGKDGSSAFNQQHGSDQRPKTLLAGFKIGTLSN